MKMLHITINGQSIQVPEGTTILDASKVVNLDIPTLCHLKLDDFGIVNQTASCRVCMVEVEGRPALVPSCSELCTEGMVIRTDSMRAINARRTAVELLLSNHPFDCLTCAKNLECDLQALAQKLGIREIQYTGEKMNYPMDTSSYALIKDPNKCIMCRRCETMCNEVQTCGILSAVNRGFDVFVGPAFNLDMADTSCTFCGQCVAVCPTAALTEVNNTSKVWNALNDPTKHVVVQVAPAVRVAIGELFDMPPGTISTGKLVSALKALNFDSVFDTDFGADLTIMEEATELIDRIQNGGTLPMLTSCCPAWVKFFEHQFPDLLDIPSTCKSPQIMLGSMIKSYYAEKADLDPANIVSVSVMPCLAKKAEAARPELTKDAHSDVDIVITTRELGQMLKIAGIDFEGLSNSEFDQLLGESTGASVIFGTTGGVIEAAVRTAYEWLTHETLEKVEFKQLRGMEGIRSATVKVGDMNLRIGIAHGLGNARKLLNDIRDGVSKFDVIEIMACPGGCIGGGGQPYHHGDMEIIKLRQQAIYQEDHNKKLRKSHENPYILKLYKDYLGKPNSEKAHKLLHTHYTPKERI
ncbi:NADH-dependent [FeFe] hydrogenase, group A6 [Fusibacter tunisiensis]|uniref:NADH-quinone oxidoreductase subunit G/NADP-reducing hydrogenase subunit HndD n=1 Tax=Fusibacter tunisiensis TaxID=1008308 RepID=A0ABS2MRL2_9FIRM|nr:NADH-dependent [FeFe] hydrogenase, group A6 [Fusibacter tunisiensis]MBM7562042.1 NADH-quinone oxidoreductase subunit G/NADP-reducing hydrogenase subunit HndD [Fusibacter tunisiensis]